MRRGKLKGYKGNITRVVKIADARMEYFISGALSSKLYATTGHSKTVILRAN